ncbi:hypothetical protein AQJ64_12460 [Streptomyces griseoruber]|uniref:Uncharacterized protein n=1 Tax=Streptomyces griseoruber TaxID=1943 RepID=A0A101T3B3_9ACTN|nr:hypothetical protein AQJ64_12460 [Streptomyces griseoruber]
MGGDRGECVGVDVLRGHGFAYGGRSPLVAAAGLAVGAGLVLVPERRATGAGGSRGAAEGASSTEGAEGKAA